MMAPLILLLALIPGYDFEILGIWVRKIIETQIGVLIITFLMGVMIMIDGLLYNLASEMGWFVVLILQIGASLGLYVFRGQIFSAFNYAQRGVQNPWLVKRDLARSGNPYPGIERLYMQAQNTMRYRRKKPQANKEYTTQEILGRQMEDQGWQPDPMGGQSQQDNRYDRQRDGQDRQRRLESSGGSHNRQNNQVGGQNQQLIEDAGIRGESYYASRAVTDNWHDIWNSAEPVYRPRTTDKSRK